jgi:predicted transposase/invertase (TIGR01784 family)
LGKLPETAGADKKEGELLDWLRLIRSEREEEIEMLAAKTEEMRMAVGRLKQLSADERTRMLYEARQLYLMDEAARREAAVAEGEAKGRAEGKAEGKFEVARSLLARKMSVSEIVDITGLNEGDILSLQ